MAEQMIWGILNIPISKLEKWIGGKVKLGS
jgi:hypothetical protein